MVTTAAMTLANHAQHWGDGGWWPIFPIFWILFWAVLVFAFFRFRRGAGWHHGVSAESVLAERYARGEISVEEYRERLTVLKERK
ncbi:MAG: SHOCT domain-containing protein [Actinomycetota bacterium]